MSNKVVKYSFSAGEISPRLLMRGDVEAYPNAAQVVENFFIDYRGGAVSRPGSKFIGYARGPFRNVELQLAFIQGGGLVLEATDQRFRFIQRGTYVTEGGVTVSAVSGTQVTIPSHGYAVDDYLLVDGTQVRVSSVISTDVVEFEDIWGAPWVPQVGAVAGRIYELATPYAEQDLWDLNFTILESDVIITSNKYEPRRLSFSGLTSWTLSTLDISSSAFIPPSNLTATPTSTGTAYYIYAVSAVLQDGTETAPCKPVRVASAQMSTTNGASITIQWDPIADAQYYVVYRSREFLDTSPSLGEDLGYVGKAFGTEFIDKNILPDFTKSPIVPYNPFAGGAITFIGVTAEGSGYTDSSVLTVSGATGGTGFSGYPIITKGDKIGGVKILNPGYGYDEPVTVSVDVGTGAAFSIEVRPLDGNWPRCACRFQQRLLFAGTDNAPSTVFGSKPGAYFNFSYTIPAQHDDSYEHDLYTEGLQYIKYMLPVSAGLMLFTDGGIYTMTGDSSGLSVTALRVQVSPQMSLGAEAVEPIVVDNDILFVQAKGLAVRALRYNPVSASYSAEDLTLLAGHLLQTYGIRDWVYAAEPFRQIVAVREDGQLLLLTYLPGQKLFAWSRAVTDGEYWTIASVREDGVDQLYVGTRRLVNGRVVWLQEVFDKRNWNTVRAAFALDCGLSRVGETQTVDLVAQSDGSFSTTASVSVGDLIVADGARIEVTGLGVGNVLAEPFGGWPIEVSGWELFRGKVTSVSGLEHLEGKEVAILADGNVLARRTVVDGTVNLDVPAWEVRAGLPFTARLQSMPIDIVQPAVQSRKRRHFQVAAMVEASRGLFVGSSFDNMTEVKERMLVTAGQAQDLYTGFRQAIIHGRWEPTTAACVEVRDPLPATILGLVVDVVFGDDDEG